MSVEKMLEEMAGEIVASLKDAAKCDKGNKAAGTRVRKAMQEVKAKAQDVRKAVLEARE
jgi:hypothetical protein